MSVVTFRASSHGGATDTSIVGGGWDFDHTSGLVSGVNNATSIVTLNAAGRASLISQFGAVARGDYVIVEG